MRRKLCIIALTTAAVLGGCGTDVPDLSNVDNDIAAQYMADALLRNDRHYEESLDYDHSILEATPTPEPTEAPTPVPEEGSQGVTGESGDTQGTPGASVDDGNGQGQAFSDVPLSDIYGIPGVTVEQTSYELKDTYGSSGYAVVPSEKGRKLVVVHFRISNENSKAKKVNLEGKGVDAQLYINGERAGAPLLSIADGDLQSFNIKIGAGKKKQGVLLFEVDKSTKISSLEVKFTKGNSQASVAVH